MSTLIAALVGSLLAAPACGSSSAATPEPVTLAPDPVRAAPAAALPPPPSDGALPRLQPGTYEVHEWGLLRGGAGDRLEVGAVGLPAASSREPMTVDKPVLYFYAAGTLRLEHVAVHASGDVREHWPLTVRGARRDVSWSDVTLESARAAGTAACAPGAYPRASEPPCVDLEPGETCESSGLGSLVAPGAACVSVARAAQPFLFYRSRTSTFTPPLRLERLPSGSVRATLAGDLPIPGALVVLRRRGGGTTGSVVAAPAPHRSVLLDAPRADDRADAPALPTDVAAAREAIRGAMRELGMTDGEIAAFLRAWEPALFGSPAHDMPVDETTVDRRGVADLPEAAESLLYFLPPGTCDGVARLELQPAPRAVRRALAIWARLP